MMEKDGREEGDDEKEWKRGRRRWEWERECQERVGEGVEMGGEGENGRNGWGRRRD